MLWPWVCFVELTGVLLGAWRWGAVMPVTGLHEASPPSGVMGIYGFMDLFVFGITAIIVKHMNTRSVTKPYAERISSP